MNSMELTSVLWAVFFGGLYIAALVFAIRDGLDKQRRNAVDDAPEEER